VLGKYHPHGDSPVYDTLVRLRPRTSRWRYPLGRRAKATSVRSTTDPGSCHEIYRGAPRADSRRENACATSTRTRFDFVPNYDGKNQEPLVLPARFPNLLVKRLRRGSRSGMATNIPAAQTCVRPSTRWIAYIDDPDIDVEGADEARSRAPDFPRPEA